MEKINYNERVYWNMNAYGSAIKVKRSLLIGALIFICIITPATNWLIPFAKKIIKTDINIRY